MVIDAVKEHMRVVCGNALDQLKGDNYEVDSCHENIIIMLYTNNEGVVMTTLL